MAMLKARLLLVLFTFLQCINAFLVPSYVLANYHSILFRGIKGSAHRPLLTSQTSHRNTGKILMSSGYKKKSESEFDLLGGKDFDLLSFRSFYREALLR